MRVVISFLAGFICFVFFVFQPIRANLIASLSTVPNLQAIPSAFLLEYASKIDPCSTEILNQLGDTWFSTRNYIMAAVAYGRGMKCSPGNAAFRFKYGETIVGMGFNGLFSVQDALTLEPHDPYFKSEVQRFKELQRQSQ